MPSHSGVWLIRTNSIHPPNNALGGIKINRETDFAGDTLVGVFTVTLSLMPPMRCFINLDELQITRVFRTG